MEKNGGVSTINQTASLAVPSDCCVKLEQVFLPADNSESVPWDVAIIDDKQRLHQQAANSSEAFNGRYHLKRHINIINNNVKPVCCSEGYNTYQDHVQHVDIMHSNETKCFKCQKELNPLLTEECKTSRRGCKHICKDCSSENCPEIFLNSTEIKPMTLHRKIQPREYVCKICKNTYSREEIKLHLLKFHSNRTLIKCNMCPNVYVKQSRLLEHMLSLHSNYRKVNRLDCLTLYKNDWFFQNHCISHTMKQPYVCCICGKGFNFEFTLKDHIKTKHKPTSVKKIGCRLCKKVSPSYSELLNHFVEVHGSVLNCQVFSKDVHDQLVIKSDTKPDQSLYRRVKLEKYTCYICKSTFTETDQLFKHLINTHSDKKKCLDCEMVFLDLYRHLKRKHSNGDQIECLNCGKIFSNNGKIRSHVTTCYNMSSQKLQVKSRNSKVAFGPKFLKSLYRHITLTEYTCFICKNTFTKTWQLFNHLINTHSDNISNKCLECQIGVSNLPTHMKSKHSNGNQFECLKCGRIFNARTNVRKHVLTCYNLTIHKLQPKPRNSKFTLDPKSLHSSYRHVTLTEYTCFICKNTFGETQQLIIHLRNTHLDKRNNTCLGCGFKSNAKRGTCRRVLRHLITKHSDGDKTECLICGRISASTENSRKHVLDSHDIINEPMTENDYPFKCAHCPARFLKKRSLLSHIQNKHIEKELIICDLCNDGFISLKTLARHLKFVHAENSVTCSNCGKKYKSKLSKEYKSHVATNCGKVACKTCGKMYTSQKAMEIHHKRVHFRDSTTLFICDICQKECVTQSGLVAHMSLHSDEKPHKCLECGKSYTVPGSLARHMMNHSGDRPHKCTICNASFTQAVILINHMRIHNDERKHQCDNCGQRFRTKYVLTMHIKRHK